MRLIDADEFAIEEPKLWDWSSVDGISSTAVLKQCIWDVQCAPTVEAIPIEWIVKRINYYSDLILTYPNEKELLYRQTDLISLLEDWEKENN